MGKPDVKVEGEKTKEKGCPTLATGGTWELMGKEMPGAAIASLERTKRRKKAIQACAGDVILEVYEHFRHMQDSAHLEQDHEDIGCRREVSQNLGGGGFLNLVRQNRQGGLAARSSPLRYTLHPIEAIVDISHRIPLPFAPLIEEEIG